MRSFHTALSCLALVSAISASPVPGDVWVVDASGAGDFLDIQAAVDAASDDDTLLIMGGTYGGFRIANKELALASDSPQTPRVNGLVTLAGLAKGGGLSLSGLHLRAGFKVNNCKGTVLFTDCTFLEPGVTTSTSGKPSQNPGMHQVLGSNDVVFSGSTLIGRDGTKVWYCGDVYDGAHGENGLWVSDSTVSLYDCFVEGGEGGDSADGGCGLVTCFSANPSWGGHGVCAVSNGLVYMDGTQTLGGLRGDHVDCDNSWGTQDGQAVHNDGTSSVLTGNDPYLHLNGPLVVRETDPMTVTITGPQGAKSYMVWSATPAWRYLGLDLGILHLKSNQLNFVYLGKVPASGTLQTSITAPGLPPGEDSLRAYMQPFALYSGSRLLGNVRSVAVIDPAL
ncbi:MAG: hypothetical protein CMJ98_09700 [Planctomycetes bacterium]|jgi:hypothetical protein|nr:hypothetical protein [Planctomycetota bacterium]